MTPKRAGRQCLCAAVLAGILVAGAARCGSSPTSPGPPAIPGPVPPAVLIGAGDIGLCGSTAVAATAQLVDRVEGIVFTTGDNAYPNGSMADFQNCYEPSWGRHRARTRPVPGNHDYHTAGGADYYAYFGANAGPPGAGYYAYTAGPWRVFALNSETPAGPASMQLQWLRTELSRANGPCAMAYWHKPLYTSGPNGPNRDMRELWRVLHDFNVDLIVNGHDHLYERFAPQDPDGRADPARGIRQITVGTGGGPLYVPITSAANTEAIGIGHGVLKLTLNHGSYGWEFLPVPGNTFADRGMAGCH